MIDETNQELEELVAVFKQAGVTVRRPDVFDHSRTFSSPDWSSDGQYNYCPRDLFVVAGETIIEAPMTLRARQHETLSFKPILRDYLRSGARWISAPKPQLLDDDYILEEERQIAIAEVDPIFDAANILRVGRDILYLVSDSGNRTGAVWLQSVLGPDYRVNVVDNVYSGSHVDTTFTLVRPGLVVANPTRVNESNLPPMFAGWDVIYLDDVHDIGYRGVAYASEWIGMNFMMLDPCTAIVDRQQSTLIQRLEGKRITPVPLSLTHARTMGGGFHCVTLDVRRKGELEDYCG